MEDYEKLRDNFVHLARIALSQRPQDVQALLHRVAKQNSNDKELSAGLIELLRKQPTRSSPLRRSTESAVPVDIDSRFQLLRTEEHPALAHEPIYEESAQKVLSRLVEERKNVGRLLEAGLEPTRTALFTGPPGVGKTMAAKWMARELGKPLLVLDLAAVMSSYLGRTGSNLRHVLDYAKSIDCILLLDELDAIAKRRDDTGEIGELKRLVTVLLQQLDDWPPSGLLLAATNHSELLDPAVWRRFEEVVEFSLPERNAVKAFAGDLLKGAVSEASVWPDALSIAMAGLSFNDIERAITNVRRVAAIDGGTLEEHLPQLVRPERHSKQDMIELATMLVDSGLVSQRKATELTGIARETIRTRSGNNVKTRRKRA
ncbi:AAA family ATPase [Luteolibacter sp. Populi]|uniref:AAA family ATPase n=1 Tax=Luteolibacter sp. Populi TaxID=3230487 RepID=UPI003466E635